MLDITEIKRGDIIWYSTQYGNYRYIALTDGIAVSDLNKAPFVVVKTFADLPSSVEALTVFIPDAYGRTHLYRSPAYMSVPSNVASVQEKASFGKPLPNLNGLDLDKLQEVE